MAQPQMTVPLTALKERSRRADPQVATLAVLIALSIQFGLGAGINLYVTVPAVGEPGHGAFFSGIPLLLLHATLGCVLIIGALSVLVWAILARNATVIVTSAVGLAAILTAAAFGAAFVLNLTNADSLGMALATAVALACYTVGLHACGARATARPE